MEEQQRSESSGTAYACYHMKSLLYDSNEQQIKEF
jgi:hypothetical protein